MCVGVLCLLCLRGLRWIGQTWVDREFLFDFMDGAEGVPDGFGLDFVVRG